MLLAVVTEAVEDVDYSMEEDVADDMGGYVKRVEEETSKEVLEVSEAHMKMGLTSHMPTINFKVQSGPHSKTRQGKG